MRARQQRLSFPLLGRTHEPLTMPVPSRDAVLFKAGIGRVPTMINRQSVTSWPNCAAYTWLRARHHDR